MNREMHRVFRASPSELRTKRRKADRLVADGGLPLRLTFRGALDWEAMVEYLTPRVTPGVESVDGGVYRRTILVDGHPGALELHPGGDDHLVLTAHLPRWEGLIHVVARVRRAFDLDADGGPASQVDLRMVGGWDPFEIAVRVILGRGASVARATCRAGRLVEHFGDPAPGLDAWGPSHTFPAPARLAEADQRAALSATDSPMPARYRQ